MNQAFAANPAICIPMTGKSSADIIQECSNSVMKNPDILEWRADFFEGIAQSERVLNVLTELRRIAGQIPILFTLRSTAEGGNREYQLASEERIGIYREVCQSKLTEYVDFELSNSPEEIRTVRTSSEEHGVKLILSYHNFESTPEEAFIREKIRLVEQYQGDVGKVAVMPNRIEDVLEFMRVTQALQEEFDVPLIAISMGELGVISRLMGWMFGSQLTFAIGDNSSAPGQIPIGDVKTVIEIIRKYNNPVG